MLNTLVNSHAQVSISESCGQSYIMTAQGGAFFTVSSTIYPLVIAAPQDAAHNAVGESPPEPFPQPQDISLFGPGEPSDVETVQHPPLLQSLNEDELPKGSMPASPSSAPPTTGLGLPPTTPRPPAPNRNPPSFFPPRARHHHPVPTAQAAEAAPVRNAAAESSPEPPLRSPGIQTIGPASGPNKTVRDHVSSLHSYTFPAPPSGASPTTRDRPVGESGAEPFALLPPRPLPSHLYPRRRNLHPFFAPDCSTGDAVVVADAADPAGAASTVPTIRVDAAAATTVPTIRVDAAAATTVPTIRVDAAALTPSVDRGVTTLVLNPTEASEPFLRLPNIPNGSNAPNEALFSFDDPGHAWMNGRPYNVLGFLGKGGFGIVHKVELLTPLGFTVEYDEAGLLDFDGKSMTTLKPITNSSGPIAVPAAEAPKLNRSGVCFALKKMEPGPEDCDWDDCLREVKLMQALKQVLVIVPEKLNSY